MFLGSHSYWTSVTEAKLWYHLSNIISYPLFASVDTGIYPNAASQYHAQPKAKRSIAMLSVDKSHARTIFVTFWNVSAALKSQLSH